MTDSDSEKSFADVRQQTAEELTRLLQSGVAVGANLDKTLLSLSGGALVLSMTFVGQFASSKLLLPVLFLSWLGFVASLVSVVFAMRAAQNAANRAAMDMAKTLEDFENKSPVLIAAKCTVRFSRDVSLNTSVRCLNICAITAFIVGLLLLGIFVGYNLWASNACPELENSKGKPTVAASNLTLANKALHWVTHTESISPKLSLALDRQTDAS